MAGDAERERRRDQARLEHQAAVARGEKRILRTTRTGELHSYRSDEIGFSPGRGSPQVSTWWGMGILFCCMTALALGPLAFLITLALTTDSAPWGVLVVTVLGALGAWYTFGLARAEYRAKKLRRARGVPEPGAR